MRRATLARMSRKQSAVLVVDAGTSSSKVGIVDRQGTVLYRSSERYGYATPEPGYVELDFEVLWRQLARAVAGLPTTNYQIEAVGLSVLRPGLVPLDSEGTPLRPAIIHLDRRSEAEAKAAVRLVGEERFLSVSGNLPYPGGMSLSSMLWIQHNEPEVFEKVCYFGHTNTFLLKRMVDTWAIDTTNASFNGLYRTLSDDGWDQDLVSDLGFALEKMPPVYHCADVVGGLTETAARQLGLPSGVPVIAGGGDTGIAAFGAGVNDEGDILNSTGTVEVMVLSTEKPVARPEFLLCTHPLPGKWLVMNIIGAGGGALEWVRREFYREIDPANFYSAYLPEVMRIPDTSVSLRPFFAGDRTSFERQTAEFSGITLAHTRDDLLKATANAIVAEMHRRYDYYLKNWSLSGKMRYTGGGIEAMLRLKKATFPDIRWEEAADATITGAAKLAWMAADAGAATATPFA